MPVRLTNRFSADRDMGPARVDTNFEDVRRWSGDVDASITGVTNALTDEATARADQDALLLGEINDLTTFANAIQTDLGTEIGDREAADLVLAGNITTNANAITGLNIVQNAQCIVSQSSQAIANSTFTNVAMPTEIYDLYAWHTGTSHIITPTVAGLYTATGLVNWSITGSSVTRAIGQVWVNGTVIVGMFDIDGISGPPRFMVPTVDFYLNGTSDTVSLAVWQNSGASKNVTAQLSVRLVNAF